MAACLFLLFTIIATFPIFCLPIYVGHRPIPENLIHRRPDLELLSRSCRQERPANASIYYRTYTEILDKMNEEMEDSKFSIHASGDVPNRLYVMSQCMDYLGNDECGKCFTQISTYLSSCFSSTGGRVYLGGCFIRAENYDFTHEATGPEDNVSCSSHPVAMSGFSSKVMKLTDMLVEEIPKQNFFAVEKDISNAVEVYGVGICWKSLDEKDCSLCLEQARIASQTCLPNKEGYALFTGCVMRYANYKFSDEMEEHEKSGAILVFIIYIFFALLISTSAVIVGCCVGRYTYDKKNHSRRAKGKEMAMLNSRFNFKYSALEEATKNFSEGQKLGQGGYGEVFKGSLPDGREIAVKRLFIGAKAGNDHVFNEMDIINQAQHRNLVHFLGCCFTLTDIFLIYEFLPNKSLDLILFDSEKKKELDWKKRLGIIMGTAEGLEYLHKHCQVRIIHRDIKASNILLDSKYKPKITDFGLARFYSNDKSLESTAIAGTIGYMAPEYLAQGRLTEKVDVFSFGVLVIEIVSGERNNKTASEETFDTILTRMWRHYQSNSVETIIDESLRNDDIEEIKRVAQVGLLCTQESPSLRPTMTAVVQMLKIRDLKLATPAKPPFTDECLEFTDLSGNQTSNVPEVLKDTSNVSDVNKS